MLSDAQRTRANDDFNIWHDTMYPHERGTRECGLRHNGWMGAYAALSDAARGPGQAGELDPTVVAVMNLMRARAAKGLAKYGTTTAANPLPLKAWLQHALEECLDQAVYLKRAMDEL